MKSIWHIKEFINEVDSVGEESLQVIGGQLVSWASELCPVVTSNLVNSIVYSTQETQSEPTKQTTGESIERPDKLAVRYGSNVVYVARIEYGFTGRDSLGRYYNQPGIPFLRAAIISHKKDIVEIFKKIMSKLNG